MLSPPASSALMLIQQAIQKELRWKRIFSVALCLFGGVFVLLFMAKSYLLTVLGIVAFLAGGVLTLTFLRQNAVKNPLSNLLNQEPECIVWVYSVVTQRMPFGIRFIENSVFYFKLIDGTDITLGVPQSEIPILSAYLNELLPHTTFGYSEDRAQWYLAAPEMLIRYEGKP